jgi:hypothetical protein
VLQEIDKVDSDRIIFINGGRRLTLQNPSFIRRCSLYYKKSAGTGVSELVSAFSLVSSPQLKVISCAQSLVQLVGGNTVLHP